jgi:hypothetical protein
MYTGGPLWTYQNLSPWITLWWLSWLKQLGDIRQRTQLSRVRIRLPPQSPEHMTVYHKTNLSMWGVSASVKNNITKVIILFFYFKYLYTPHCEQKFFYPYVALLLLVMTSALEVLWSKQFVKIFPHILAYFGTDLSQSRCNSKIGSPYIRYTIVLCSGMCLSLMSMTDFAWLEHIKYRTVYVWDYNI